MARQRSDCLPYVAGTAAFTYATSVANYPWNYFCAGTAFGMTCAAVLNLFDPEITKFNKFVGFYTDKLAHGTAEFISDNWKRYIK